MKLYIKHMVSRRCKMLVKDELNRMGIDFIAVNLGEIEMQVPLSKLQLVQLEKVLRSSGLELMDNKKAILIEQIKHIIIHHIHYSDELIKINFSDYLSNELKYNYTYLSNLFSELENHTIEHYIIIHKIERVKELIAYNELNLTEIAFKLNYSSVAHLSAQFKKITGITPSFYKKLQNKGRINLESL